MRSLVLLCIALAFAGCKAESYRKASAKLNKKLSTALPLPSNGSALNIDIAFQLLNIDSVDKSNNQVGLVVSKRARWSDFELAWDEFDSEFSSIFVQAKNIWLPDTALYNSAAPEAKIQDPVVMVINTGMIIMSASARIFAMCDVSGVDTYSGASCELVFGSWSYRSELLTLREPRDFSFFTDSFSSSSKYELLSSHVRKEVRNYDCCNYEAKYTYDVFVVSFSFREKSGASKKGQGRQLQALRALLN